MSRQSKLLGIVLAMVLVPMMGQACPPEMPMPAPDPVPGAAGDPGAMGNAGTTGPAGPAGAVGPAGPAGASPFSLVGNDAVLNGVVFADAFSSNSPLLLQTAGTTRIRIDDVTGNVGVNTQSAPTANLHVVGNFKVQDPMGGAITIDGNNIGSSATGGGLFLNPNNNRDVSLANGGGDVFLANGGGDVILANGGGDVGVGTTSPTANLHVVGNFKVQNPMGGATTINGNEIGSSASGDGLFLNPNNNRDVFLATGGGNVGIGTIMPDERLHVSGNVRIDGNICSTNGMIMMCSDKRFKMDIKTVEDALDKIVKLRGVNFDWRRDEYPDHNFSKRRQVGFIAQEIMEVVPQAVSQGSDGYYSVDYARLTPVLVEAVKELKDEHIAALRTEYARLRLKNEELAARLARLEALHAAE